MSAIEERTPSVSPTVTQEDAADEQSMRNGKQVAQPEQPEPQIPHPQQPLARATTSASDRPYSAFSKWTKWFVVVLSGFAGIFSPISSNIFVPAIPTLTTVFNKSNADITLAVTVYLIFQAITPSFFGSASDSFGRRPIYIATLTTYLGANIGLALCPTDAYWLLLVLRCLQATGGSAVIAIGAGAISDIAVPSERGKYFAVFQGCALIGPALGPTIGALLNSGLGWRSIFWFLTISCGVVLVPLIFFFPETLRSLVGDGSIPPPTLNCSPMVMLERRRMAKDADAKKIERPERKKYQPLSSFTILLTPEITLMYIFASLLYLEFYAVLAVYSTALKDTYNLSSLKIGLCYLPAGLGTIFTSFINGRQLDYYYKKEMLRAGGDYRAKPETFRIELTRIRCLFPFIAVFLTASVSLGWCLEAKAPLAATLVVNFFVGIGSGTTGTATVYGQDMKAGQGGAVSASFNLVRCIFGAIGTACIQQMYAALGAGWCFVLLSGICAAGLPLPFVVIRYARGWRERRAEKERVKKEEKERREREGDGASPSGAEKRT